MAAGDREINKAHEETTTRNVRAGIDHSNETRKIVRELEERIKRLENMVVGQQATIENVNRMVAQVLQKQVAGGTS